jgi:hypothetical protein
MPTYDDIDEKYEYLDLSCKNMSNDEIKDILEDLVEDTMIKHINLSYNVSLDVASDPDAMDDLIASLTHALRENDCLLALDWVGNHLGDNGPHPPNDHYTEYIIVLADAVAQSSVVRIDLSDNMLTGKKNRKFSGLARFIKMCIPHKHQVFRFRSNGINSLGIALFSGALGLESSLQELDLSDNLGGKDPYGRDNSEGIRSLCINLSQTHSLKKLKLARNCLHDEEIIELSLAISKMPNLSHLDLAGNEFRGVGMEALKDAAISHGSFFKVRYALF